MGGGVGIAGEGADAVHGAALVQPAVVAMEQVGVGREELEHLGETASRKAVIAADAGAFLEVDAAGKAMRGEHWFATSSDFSRLTGPPNLMGPLISRKTWLAVKLFELRRRPTRISVSVRDPR